MAKLEIPKSENEKCQESGGRKRESSDIGRSNTEGKEEKERERNGRRNEPMIQNYERAFHS